MPTTPAPATAAPVPLDDPDPGWLREERERLLAVLPRAVHPAGGFAWLGVHGVPERDRPVTTWVTCRMTWCAALGVLLGHDELAGVADHGLTALRTVLSDDEHGGWLSTAGQPGGDKEAYTHAFVVLATAAATVAGRAGARELLDRALAVLDEHFWDDDAGLVVDVWDGTFSMLDPYRGANANMHTVEALLAAADATGDARWRDRALRICARLVDGAAREHGWRMPEHYDPRWRPLPDYSVDRPADPFRPYGVTPGHLLEWSRLCLHLRAGLGERAPGWLLEGARGLFTAGARDGWPDGDGAGPVYTTDTAGVPVVRLRLHWVVAEGTSAAAALHAATGDPEAARRYRTWWRYAREHLLDPAGSWWHELDEQQRPSGELWSGQPDLYHALGATLVPVLPLAPSAARALREAADLGRGV